MSIGMFDNEQPRHWRNDEIRMPNDELRKYSRAGETRSTKLESVRWSWALHTINPNRASSSS